MSPEYHTCETGSDFKFKIQNPAFKIASSCLSCQSVAKKSFKTIVHNMNVSSEVVDGESGSRLEPVRRSMLTAVRSWMTKLVRSSTLKAVRSWKRILKLRTPHSALRFTPHSSLLTAFKPVTGLSIQNPKFKIQNCSSLLTPHRL